MKNLITYLKSLWSRVADSQSSDVGYDSRLTVGSPSGLESSTLLKFVSVLVLILTIGVGNVWGASVTLTLSDNSTDTWTNAGASGGGTAIAMCDKTVTGISISGTSGYCNTSKSYTQIYSGSDITITSTAGNMTSVAFTCTGGNTNDYSPSKFALKSGSAGSYSQGASGAKVGTWTGNASTFTLHANAQVRVTSISVTYTAAATPTITPSVSELDWGTVAKGASLTTKTFTITGTNLTSAALVYSASGGYSVSPSGKAGAAGTLSSQTLTVTPPSTATPGTYNSTVSITGGGLASAVTVNVKLKVENTDTFIDEVQNTSGYTSASPHIEQGSYGTTPTITDKSVATSGTCEQLHYHFVGWITAAKYEAGTSIAIGDLQTPTSATGATYYAVWAKQGAGGGAVTWTQVTSVSVGDEVVIAQIDDGTKEMDGFNTTTTTSNNYGTGATFSTSPAGTMVWTVEAGNSAGQFSFKNGDYYLNLASDNNYLNGSATKNANSSWTVSTSSSRAVVTNASQTSRKVMWNKANTRFASYAKNHGNNSGQYYYHIVFYKRSGGVSYEDYIAKCCTPLGSINGSISWSNAATAVVTWDKLDDQVSSWALSWSPNTGGSSITSAIADYGLTQKTATVSGLACNTAYTFTLTPTLKSGVCTPASNPTIESTSTKWTISKGSETGGTFTIGASSSCSGSSISISATPSTGYEFTSWTIDKDGGGTVDPAASSATTSFTMPSDNVTVTANFSCVATTATVAPTSAAGNYGWRYTTGETIDLTCSTTGAMPTGYQWQKYIGDTWTDISTATNASAGTARLQIANCTSSDGGSYRCVVTTGTGCSFQSDGGVGYFVRVFTFNGNYSGSGFSENAITWTGEYTGTVTLSLTESSIYEFKVYDNNGKTFGNGTNNYIIQPVNWNCGINNSNCRLFTGPAGNYTFTLDVTNAGAGSPYVNVQVAYPSVSHPAAGYVYVSKWWNCYPHFWDGSGNALTPDGYDPQIETYTTICENDYWYFPLLNTYVNVAVKDNATWDYAGNNSGSQSMTGQSGKYLTHNGVSWGWQSFATYTISFAGNGNDGGSMANVNGICPNGNRTLAENGYSLTGYHFDGWKTNTAITINTGGEDEAVAVNGIVPDEATIKTINSNITLTAQWEPNDNTAYTVKHYKQKLDNTYDESPDDTDNLTGTTGASVTPPVKSYTGFTAPSTQTVSILADGSRVVTYQYTRNSYTLTWVLNGGTVTTAGTCAAVDATGSPSGSVKYGASITAPIVAKTGYNMTWSSSPAATMPATNTTYTANWSANSYDVTLKPNTGSGADQVISATYDAAMPTTLKGGGAVTVHSKSGYTLLGYWDDASAGNQYYSYNAGTSTLSSFRTWNKTAATNLYAHWQANNYTITLDNEGADSGKEGTESISVTFNANTNLTGTITKPIKDGYLFGGYFVGDDGTGTQIIDADGNVIASVASYTSATKQWIYANNITLHAKWTQVYTVTWSVNGETWSSGVVDGNTYVVNGQRVSALPTAPTSSDCDDSKVFVGWRATAIAGTSVSAPDGIFTNVAGSPAIDADKTFYAVFADKGKAARTTLYEEPFKGTAGSNTDWASAGDYFDNANTASITTTTSWKVSKYTTECSDNDGASGGSHMFCGSASGNIIFNFGNKSTYTDLVLSFNYRNNAAGGSPRSISCTVSGDGGESWSDNIIDVASVTTQTWNAVSYNISNSSTSAFQVKWTATAANPSRVDDIKLTGCLITYSNYVTSCSSCDADATFTNTTPAVSDIDCTSATLTGGLATVGADGCHVSDYGFVIGTSDDPVIGGSGVTKLQVGTSDPTIGEDFSYDATGLTKGTRYYIRAYAINRHGTAYSSSTNFWTNNVSSIAIATAPTKTNYIVGETFDATGMVVTATMASGATEDVTSDVTYSSSALTAGTSQNFAINYTLCETAKSVNQVINVYTLAVTEGANPSYGTATNSSANIVSITGLGDHKTYTVTVTSSNATAVDNGDNTWSIINPTGNVTVRVDYADAVQVKVYYKVDGVTVTGLTQDVYQSETTTLPTASELATAMTAQSMDLPDDDYPNFVGWSETEFSSQTSEPTIVSGTPAINAEKTYYAVYTNLSQVQIEYSITSGYAAEANKTIDGQTITYGYLYPGNYSGTRFIQFQKNGTDYGRIYNSTSMANLIKLEAGYYNSESAIPVYACSAAGTITGSAISAESHEGSDPYVYTFPSNTSYFMVKGDNSTVYKPKWLKIYYCSSTVYYMTQFCTRYTITGASTSGTAVTGGTLTSSANSTCEGKSMTLSAAVNAGYAFGGWKIVKTGVVPEADVTSTLLPGDNASSLTPAAFSMPAYGITVSATITEKEVTGWTWKQELADASEITIPATVELYIGQQAKFNLKTYDPADVLAGKKGYSADYTNADLAQDNKAGAYYVTRAKIAKESTTLTLTSTSNGEVQEVITIRIKALPLVHFVDLVHGETFADVVANVDASEKRTVYTTKPTPTHSDVSDPGASYNTCEREHLHLIGWIESEWADEHPNAEPGDITGAGAGNYYAAGANIDLVAQNGKTFYAVWAKFE